MINPTSNNKLGNIPADTWGGEIRLIGGGMFPSYQAQIDNPTMDLPTYPINQNLPQNVITAIQNAMNNNQNNCSCLHGTAYIDNTGNCRCENDIELVPPVKVIDTKNGKPVIYYTTSQTQTTQNTQTDIIQTIKDNPLIAIGAAIGLIFLLRSK